MWVHCKGPRTGTVNLVLICLYLKAPSFANALGEPSKLARDASAMGAVAGLTAHQRAPQIEHAPHNMCPFCNSHVQILWPIVQVDAVRG